MRVADQIQEESESEEWSEKAGKAHQMHREIYMMFQDVDEEQQLEMWIHRNKHDEI